MSISTKLNEGLIYRFLKTSIRMRRLQKERNKVGIEKEIRETEILFDAQLDLLLKNVDEVYTERVIYKTGEISLK